MYTCEGYQGFSVVDSLDHLSAKIHGAHSRGERVVAVIEMTYDKHGKMISERQMDDYPEN